MAGEKIMSGIVRFYPIILNAVIFSYLIFSLISYLKSFDPKISRIIYLFIFLFSFFPVNHLQLYAYFRGVFGDLSLTTFFIVCLILIERFLGKKIVSDQSFNLTMIFIILTGFFLYPLSLGISGF